ncbi:DUF6138 family protein [Paenibacillus aurantiacus]|uniref:DUF6138 family protein n=1 Tax=Paenibacillus aurantiacus TaxID=1936118 RepID=A0ABV5KH45_9BACL
MNTEAERILQEIMTLLTRVYSKEKARIDSLSGWSPLHPGIMDYVKVSFIEGPSRSYRDRITLDVHEPLSFSDDAYAVETELDLEALSDDALIHAFYPALRARVEQIFMSDEYGEHFFGYKLRLAMEVQRKSSTLLHQEELRHDGRLNQLKQQLNRFMEAKVWKELPVLPSDKDDFFFARHLMNPDLMEQDPAVVEPINSRLNDKMTAFPKRKEKWQHTYIAALREWAEEKVHSRYCEPAETFGIGRKLLPDDERPSIPPRELAFFLYAALQIGRKEPATRKAYLELAAQLGSEQATVYLKTGSGRFAAGHEGTRMSGKANDILQTIEIRIHAEEEAAYREALEYISGLLREGFPKSYELKLKSAEKHWLPVANLAKSKLHQFFANALRYDALFPQLAAYAELAMEEFAWYGDVESGPKSIMPGTYAVMGLGLLSEDYGPLVRRYMELVDSEHQSAQDGYAEAYVAQHGWRPDCMDTLVSILLGGSDMAKPFKAAAVDTPQLADALIQALADKADHLREVVLYRLFGSEKNRASVLRKAQSPLKERLEVLMGTAAARK